MMATADDHDEEEPMDFDDSSPSGPPYIWSDYVCNPPKKFLGNFTHENVAGIHRWNITNIQYDLINHFHEQEVEKLKGLSTYLFSEKIQETFPSEKSPVIVKIMKDMEEKLTQLFYVELNDTVSHELMLLSSLFKEITNSQCLVFVPFLSKTKGVFVFGKNISVLEKALEVLCAEYDRRKKSNHGSTFQSSAVSRQRLSSLEKQSTLPGSLASSQMSSSVGKNSTNGSTFQSPAVPSQTIILSSAQKPTRSREKMDFLIGSLRVKIYQSSILDVRADAIVNAADEFLTSEAGVSKAIYEAAGYDYSRECEKLLKEEGKILKTSKCYSSKPECLRDRFKFILHAVGPRWNNYEDKEICLQVLRETVCNVLRKAESLYVTSLVIPAISSGNFCVPTELCAESYILGIDKFQRSDMPRYIKEVYLVDCNPKVITELLLASKRFKEDPSSILSSKVKLRYPHHFQGTMQVVARATAQTNHAPAGSQPLQFKAGNIVVKVKEGSILNVKADAVVNAANENLSHGAGVAFVISEAAGYEFDAECQSILTSFNRALNPTEVVESSPGKLIKNFKCILNAVGPKWNQYPDKTVCLLALNQTIKNILEKAEKLRLSSLAMPAISSGIFGVPLKLCAEMYVLGIHEYSKQMTPFWLKEVLIVDIDPSVCAEVKSAYHHYKDDPSSLSVSTARSRYPALMKTLITSSMREKGESTNRNGRRNRFSESSSVAKNPEPSTASSGRNVKKHETNRQSHSLKLLKLHDEKIGQEVVKVFSFEDVMVVKIYTGSIVRFQGDAIICSNNERMSGVGPLATAIATSGGSKYSESYTKIRTKYLCGTSKGEPGDIETCSGGNLSVRFVVHTVISSMSIADERNLCSYRKALMNIFCKISTYRKSRKFAMPLIGAGQIEKNSEDLRKCCLTLFQVLADLCQDHQSNCAVKELHLINKNPTVTKSLVDVFECNVSKEANEAVQTSSRHHRSRPSSDTARGFEDETTVNRHHKNLKRQSSWTQSTSGGPVAHENEFDFRKTGARPKTGKTENWRSNSMYEKRPSTGVERKNKKPNIQELIAMSSISMGSYDESEVSGNTTSVGKKEGNIKIIGLGDDSESNGSSDDDRNEDPGIAAEVAVCVICLDDIKNGIKLTCGHEFCKGCLTQSFSQHKQACPVCGKIFGEITGNQPPGKMTVENERRSLPGYEGCGTIVVKYKFNPGTQGPDHPNPGEPYDGTERRGFLPDNQEGRKVLRLLQTAFDRKLTFTIGYSRTTGKDNVVTWNDIHHKTKRDTGAQRFGYPDPTYLQRVQEELAAKGVTE